MWMTSLPLLCGCLLLLASRVTAQYKQYCQGRGYRDQKGKCVCINGFHGANCEFRYCPFGKSWLSPPIEDNSRNQPLAVCSDMGYCNIFTGLCECRDGYDGRACERIACPIEAETAAVSTAQDVKIVAINGVLTKVTSGGAAATTSTKQRLKCSGHGACMTLRQAGRTFNGLTLTNAPVDYVNWDADRIQGCVCDPGYEGYDCSRRSCPKGRDPMSPTYLSDKDETFVIQCQADRGFFSILVMGYYTEPIPFDADPAYLQYVLESLPGVGKVTVTMQSDNNDLPSVCAADRMLETEIVFNSHRGDRPPLFLTRNTANTRMWPTGSQALALGSAAGLPMLRMSTFHQIDCPVCPDCFGRIYFTYGNSVSKSINITSNNATNDIISAVFSLEDLMKAQWSNLKVEVSINGVSYGENEVDFDNSICNARRKTKTIVKLLSDYGNLPFLKLLDGSMLGSSDMRSPANITLTTNEANGILYECSNQGTCDYGSGICKCVQDMEDGEYLYRAISSDGKGGIGNRGDCGYIDVPLTRCEFGSMLTCSGHGTCNSETFVCSCYDDWYGLFCSLKQCPKGRAFFDEPISNVTAHQPVECSNQGTCDRRTGYCVCREGFSGPACEIRDCSRDSSGVSCNGHGVCVSMSRYFQFYGYSYGNASLSYLDGGSSTWDAYSWFECVCTSQLSAGFRGNPIVPSVGPRGVVSGFSTNTPPLPGWGNWDCSKRNCPTGHNSVYGYTAKREIQRIVCNRDFSTHHDADMYFVLKLPFNNEESLRIYDDATADEIKAAIEYAPSIGNVTVSFPNFKTDNIATACSHSVNQANGGFLVVFDTENGDLDLMTVTKNANSITITEYQAGYNSNEECSGTALGFCDRATGTCVCNRRQHSSNGLNQPGTTGDCSYYSTAERSDDFELLFGLNVKSEYD